MAREDCVEVEGKVLELLKGAKFKVDIGKGAPIICVLSGKLRTNYIKVTVGDTVTVSISPYDLTRGRIIWRTK